MSHAYKRVSKLGACFRATQGEIGSNGSLLKGPYHACCGTDEKHDFIISTLSKYHPSTHLIENALAAGWWVLCQLSFLTVTS